MKPTPPRNVNTNPIRYATVCSGIEAMTVALKGLPWAPVFFSEIEPFPCALLAHYYPTVPNLGDMTKLKGETYERQIDVLAGGTPCQAFSTAGHRGGLQDPRGQLMLSFVCLARDSRTPWVVWENVPGVLTQDNGRAFGQFLSLLTGRAIFVPSGGWKNFGIVTPSTKNDYGVAWRVLDAQSTRVDKFPGALPQRRRRVWLVAHRGDWQGPGRILYESPEGREPDRPPCEMDAQEDPASASRGPISVHQGILSHADLANVKERFYHVAPTIVTGEAHAVAVEGQKLRYFTPVECERLMGFPDGYTDIPFRGLPASRAVRNKALGNSWAINCARWVLLRLNREIQNPPSIRYNL